LDRAEERLISGTCVQELYAPGGSQKLAQITAGTPTKIYVPLPGGAVAAYGSSGLVSYRHPDWLGSMRFVSTPSRTFYYSGAYAPFGEWYSQTGTTTNTFTGVGADTENGQFDFLYRRYSPVQGRWISPDRAGLAVVRPRNPQSWNRYAYVTNRPLTHVDAVGMEDVVDGGGIFTITVDVTEIDTEIDVVDTYDPVETIGTLIPISTAPSSSGSANGAVGSASAPNNGTQNACPAGTTATTKNMLVTGYDNSFQSTGKNPGDPGYGLTASGSVAANGTIAAPRTYSFGTQMFIPGYGLGTVLDRGGAIKNAHIDLWFPSTQQAINWGAQHLQVTVCQ